MVWLGPLKFWLFSGLRYFLNGSAKISSSGLNSKDCQDFGSLVFFSILPSLFSLGLIAPFLPCICALGPISKQNIQSNFCQDSQVPFLLHCLPIAQHRVYKSSSPCHTFSCFMESQTIKRQLCC